jgi:hypothetical protein
MNADDVTEVLDFVELMFPDQDFPEQETDRWILLLQRQPGTLADGKEAVLELASRQGFVKPHEVITEIKRIRDKRLADVPVFEVPDFDDDDHYRPELLATLSRIADGGQGLAQISQTPKELEAGEPDRAYEASVLARAAVHGTDPEFVRQRDASLRVFCEWCKAGPGEVCTVGDEPTLVPAHHCRLVKAGVVEDVPRPSREEQIALLEADIAKGKP